MNAQTHRITFPGSQGHDLAARLDMPLGSVRAFALFAHCFTCSKDVLAARRIAAELARMDIAVLRFDFTGLGSSEGEFANTNFSSNVEDLVAAADYLRRNHAAPDILIGHSLGGAAVLAAAGRIPEAQGVVTIGAPSDAGHVIHNFGASLEEIEQAGSATVTLGAREFTIRKQFLDDVRETRLDEAVANLRKSLMIMHSPVDQTVGVDNAAHLFQLARHPKSFVSLDNADHLLTNPADASFVASMISAFASRFLARMPADDAKPHQGVKVTETGEGKFQTAVQAGRHRLYADEPLSYGGLDTGPSPYDYVAIALAACTSMTLRMYADRTNLDVGRISVDVDHKKIHVDDCETCTDEQKQRSTSIDRFSRHIRIDGTVDEETRRKLLYIADKCPVHRTLHHGAVVMTDIRDADSA